jgi:hypothetical protein
VGRGVGLFLDIGGFWYRDSPGGMEVVVGRARVGRLCEVRPFGCRGDRVDGAGNAVVVVWCDGGFEDYVGCGVGCCDMAVSLGLAYGAGGGGRGCGAGRAEGEVEGRLRT